MKMLAKHKITIVMPCYNEKTRIIPVLNEVKASGLADEIIVVDDGSSKITKNVLSALDGITLITHKKNLGKAAALKTGVLASHGDIIVFVDSDLVNFKRGHLLSLVKPVAEDKYDIVLSEKEIAPYHTKFCGFNVAYTGERAIKSSLLKKHLSVFDVKGYVIEAAMNEEFFGNYRVGSVFFNRCGQYSKSDKYGMAGLKKDFKMLQSILDYLGLAKFLSQMSFAYKLSQS